MRERAELLMDLVADVLGPRGGPEELLPSDQDPRDEYITGVLEPDSRSEDRDENAVDADADDLGVPVAGDAEAAMYAGAGEEDDDEVPVGIVAPGGVAPGLDPRSQPRSIGISFTVQSATGSPAITVYATWARYRREGDGWRRRPKSYLTGSIPAKDADWEAGDDVRIHLRARGTTDGLTRISIYLVNTRRLRQDERRETKDFVFQPQIRVAVVGDTHVVPVRTVPNVDPEAADDAAGEEAALALIYANRAAMARGHLCGATWKSIDPERPHGTIDPSPRPPFAWTDAESIPEDERVRFAPADVRTEMVPCYPVEAPRMEWDDQYGPPPLLDPERLAETWAADALHRALQPLVDGYNGWLDGWAREVELSDGPDRDVLAENIALCRHAAKRMRDGIEVLLNDEDARLAFCFANKSMSLQAQWAAPGRGKLVWRPFQLAFILLNIPALVRPERPDRAICDLLWFPTGGGKTEAYLGLAAFSLALRRRRAQGHGLSDISGAGVGVLSRYTLRLLTIQQFRRALGMITACEVLRVAGLETPNACVGWRPQASRNQETFLWGGTRFSAGLWVGGNLTPNSLHSIGPLWQEGGQTQLILGALDILQGGGLKGFKPANNPALTKKLEQVKQYHGTTTAEGDPAQVPLCPCCQAVLAIPEKGLAPGTHALHFVHTAGSGRQPSLRQPSLNALKPAGDACVVTDARLEECAGSLTLTVEFTIADGGAMTEQQLNAWWQDVLAPALGNAVLLSARPSRPGYFIQTFSNKQGNQHQCDFEILCPNPGCLLNKRAWADLVPLHRGITSAGPDGDGQSSFGIGTNKHHAALPPVAGLQWQEVPAWYRIGTTKWVAQRIPIPAYTVDDQVYHRCPSLVVATVDKFARLAYKPEAASLFGNVERYHSRWGYYRAGCPPQTDEPNLPSSYQEDPRGMGPKRPLHRDVWPFMSPDLILQDELHLIEGALGSMVGLYETAIDVLCERQIGDHVIRPKYVASTATVRQAGPQVRAVFDRQVALFPPSARTADDRFFAVDQETHPLDSARPGRLYVGVCAPGKGAQSPLVRTWSALLQGAEVILKRCELAKQPDAPEADRFFTLVGYFNAIRELAGALALYHQDIRERMTFRFGTEARKLDAELELSSRTDSLVLPSILERLKDRVPTAVDVVLATSMFGTGVDVDRLGLMVVNGQPKTTASYIQATGRVGRQGGGLVVTFFRASRPRDLDHYEFFTGYHRALYRHVEPVTVAPFSPRARERSLGPLAVILLRHATTLNGYSVPREWRVQQRLSGAFFSEARLMSVRRYKPEVEAVAGLLEKRSMCQPVGRRPVERVTRDEVLSELDVWATLAKQQPDTNMFVYSEPAFQKAPSRSVILGDAQHSLRGLPQAYRNTPQSLRDVEDTTSFRV